MSGDIQPKKRKNKNKNKAAGSVSGASPSGTRGEKSGHYPASECTA